MLIYGELRGMSYLGLQVKLFCSPLGNVAGYLVVKLKRLKPMYRFSVNIRETDTSLSEAKSNNFYSFLSILSIVPVDRLGTRLTFNFQEINDLLLYVRLWQEDDTNAGQF